MHTDRVLTDRVLTRRVLNRTLLQRQHLLEPVDRPALAVVDHLLGLQAQEVLPPYLSLRARLRDFKPSELSDTLASRATVRLFTMRGTIHLLTSSDALMLRPFVQPMLTKVLRSISWGKDFPADRYDDVVARTRAALADGPMSSRRLGELLAETDPGRSPSDCVNLAKHLVPLVQLPPRGLWGQSGGQVYDTLERWLGRELSQPRPEEVVRRYLAAYGPATPADVRAWSGATGIRPVFDALGDELVVHRDEAGRQLWDLATLQPATGEEPAPVRLLGRYDNVWLSHAGRDRVTSPDNRKRWMGPSGGIGATIFVDGWLQGTWRQTKAAAVDVDLFRALDRSEREGLDAEIASVETFLAG